MNSGSSRKTRAIEVGCGLTVVILAGLLAYANSFQVPFALDDHHALLENWLIRSPADLPVHAPRYLAYLSFALNYALDGYDVVGYHVVNLAIHLCSALLVFALLRLTFQTPYFANAEPSFLNSRLAVRTEAGAPYAALLAPRIFIPLFVALLFVVHPIQTQAVTYIVQRMTSLAALFYLLALVLYALGRIKIEQVGLGHPATSAGVPDEQGRGSKKLLMGGLLIGAAAVMAILAMKTKEIAFTLPFAALLYELFFFSGVWKKRLLYLCPLLATLPVVPFSVVLADLNADPAEGGFAGDSAEGAFAAGDLPRSVYLLTQFRVIVTYLRLLVMPVNQNLDYDYPVYQSFFAPPVFLSFLLLAGLFGLAVYLYVRSRPASSTYESAADPDGTMAEAGTSPTPHSSPLGVGPAARLAAFGILWFFLTLTVESSLVPIKDVIAEHRLYLPSIGFLLVCSVAVLLLAQCSSSAQGMAFILLAALMLVPLFGYATWQRNHVWGDNIRLWQDVVAKSPEKARPYNNLAFALQEEGRFAESIDFLSRSIELDPDHPHAYNNLGRALIMTNRSEEAIPLLKKAIGLDLRYKDAYVNLAAAHNQLRQFRQAVAILEKNIGWMEKSAEAHYHLGVAYAFLGDYEAARDKMATVARFGANHLVQDLRRLLLSAGRE